MGGGIEIDETSDVTEAKEEEEKEEVCRGSGRRLGGRDAHEEEEGEQQTGGTAPECTVG